MEDSCPATPLILSGRDPKSPLQIALSSPESDGMKSPSRDSPDSRCVICLGRLQNKSFTDSCLHQFCFQCLLQWSKIKAECPLCKQPFKSIIHNVRSNLDYDQYHVEHGEPHYVISDLMHSYNFNLIPINRRFRYSSTMTREYFRELAESFLAHTRQLPEESYQINPLVPVDPIPASGVRRSNRLNSNSSQRRTRQRGTSDFRRNIYAQDLWVQDLADVSGRYRECTPQFYRENPAQIHRIIPWLNREVNVLLRDCESHAAYVLSRIVSLLTLHPIRSREFREQVQPYFGDRTDHFIHELYTFARSVYDIAGFDQNAVYGTNPNYATEVQEISSSSADDDSDIEVLKTVKSVERASKKSSQEHKETRAGFKKLLLKRASGTDVQLDEPVAGPSGVASSGLCDSISICESDPEEVKVLEFVKPEPEVVILSSGEEAHMYSDLDTCNGEYAEVIHSDISKLKQSSHFENDRKLKRTRTVKGKCKSNGFGLKGKQKSKYINSRKHRSSSNSSVTSSSSSRSTSTTSSSNSNVNSSSSSNSISGSSTSRRSSSSSSDDCKSDRTGRSRNRIRKSSSSKSDESKSTSTSSRSSRRSSSRTRRKKSSVSWKKSKKKTNYKTSISYKSSVEAEKKKKKRVKSCVIVPKLIRRSSSSTYTYSPEPKRLQSYWSIKLGNPSLKWEQIKPKRKYRDDSSEEKSQKRNKKSNSSERTAHNEGKKMSCSWRSLESISTASGSGDFPITNSIHSSVSGASSWPVKSPPCSPPPSNN